MRVDDTDISAYIDGEIEDETLRAAIEEEIAARPGEANVLRGASALLREDMEEPDIHDAIMKRVERVDRFGESRGKQVRWFGWVMTVAAALMILFAVADFAGFIGAHEVPEGGAVSPTVASTLRLEGIASTTNYGVIGEPFDSQSVRCVTIDDEGAAVLVWDEGSSFGVYRTGDSLSSDAFISGVENDVVTIFADGQRPIELMPMESVRLIEGCRIALSDQDPVDCVGWALGNGKIILLSEDNVPVATVENAAGRWRMILSTDKGLVELENSAMSRDSDPITLAGTTDDGETAIVRLWMPVT